MKKKDFQELKFNVSEVSRKNKIEYFKKWFIILFLLFLVFILVVYGWKFFVKPKLVEINFNNFPISAGFDDGVVLEKTENGFCLLSRRNLSFYENDGSCIKNFDFNLEKPSVHCCKNFVLVYDRGGRFCSLLNFENRLCSVVCDENILLAKVAENGNFVVATQSDNYFTRFVVYDKNGKQIFKWNFAENLIVDFDFFRSGKGCFVCALGVSKTGFEKAVVYGFDFNKVKEPSKQVLEGSMPVFLKVLNSGCCCLVCFNGLFLLDNSCGVLKSLQFDDDWNSFFISERGYFVFSFENRLIVYDKFANILEKCDLNEIVRKVKIIGKHIFILVNGSLIVCNLKLKILKIIELNKYADDFFCSGNYGYFLFGGRVDKFKIF